MKLYCYTSDDSRPKAKNDIPSYSTLPQQGSPQWMEEGRHGEIVV